MRTAHLPLAFALLLSASGCPQQQEAPAPTDGPQAAASFSFPERVKIKRGDGSTAFELKRKDDGAKVVDAAEAELYRLKLDGPKLKLKDAQDAVLGYVIHKEDRFKLEGPDQATELYSFQRQADGDWKLEDGAGTQLYEVKRRDYGWTVRDAQEADLFKVKLKDGKTSLRGPDDQTRYSTKDPVSGLAFAALGFEALDEGQRLALLVQLQAAGL